MRRANFTAFFKRSVWAEEEILIFVSSGGRRLRTAKPQSRFPADGARGSQPPLCAHHSKAQTGTARWQGPAKATHTQRGERAAAAVWVSLLQVVPFSELVEIWILEIWRLCLQPGTTPLL